MKAKNTVMEIGQEKLWITCATGLEAARSWRKTLIERCENLVPQKYF
jgi:hypothetical protein